MPGPKAPSSRRKGADLGWTLGVRCPGSKWRRGAPDTEHDPADPVIAKSYPGNFR